MQKYPYQGITYILGILLSLVLILREVLLSSSSTLMARDVTALKDLSPLSGIPFRALGMVMVSAVAGLLSLLYDRVGLLDKHSNRVSLILLLSLSAIIGIGSSYSALALIVGCSLCLILLMTQYQAWETSVSKLIIGLISGTLWLLHPAYGFLLLPWLLASYFLQNLTLRSALALLIGFLIIPFSIAPFVVYFHGTSNAIEIAQHWASLLKVTTLHLSWTGGATIGLAFLSFASYSSGRYDENAKQRALGSSLLSVGLIGALLYLLFPRTDFILLPLLSMSVMGARALRFFRGRSYCIVLIIYAILLIGLSLLHINL